jgi:hypothetical protein
MNNQNEKGFHPIYILAGLYTFAIYMFPVIYFAVNRKLENENSLQMWPLGLPMILGIINLLVVILFKNKIGRIRLLNCAILIKYTLIPFYFIGGLAIAIALLLMFTPVVIMVFVGPMVAIVFSILGWIAMVGAAPFSIGYIGMSYKEGTHGKILSVLAGIFQFFFTVDVLSIMILALKEKRCVKVTIALLIILILAIVSSIIWIAATIIGALI